MGEAKNQKVKKLVKISFISLKWTVSEEMRKANPNEKTNCTTITNGRKRR